MGGKTKGLHLTRECLFGCVCAFSRRLCGQLTPLWSSLRIRARHRRLSFFFFLIPRTSSSPPPPPPPAIPVSYAGCVSGLLLFSHNPLWQRRLSLPAPCPQATEQDGVHRREGVCALCCLLPLCLFSLRLRWFSLLGLWSLFYVSWCWLPVFPLLLCLVVVMGGGRGLACLHAYMLARACVCVCL